MIVKIYVKVKVGLVGLGKIEKAFRSTGYRTPEISMRAELHENKFLSTTPRWYATTYKRTVPSLNRRFLKNGTIEDPEVTEGLK